jgi:hypothetical protein
MGMVGRIFAWVGMAAELRKAVSKSTGPKTRHYEEGRR